MAVGTLPKLEETEDVKDTGGAGYLDPEDVEKMLGMDEDFQD